VDTYDALAQTAAGTEKIVGRIEPSQLTRSTPCTEWDVRAVCNHVLGSMSLGEGIFADAPPRHAAAPGGLPDVDLVGDDPAAAYEETAEAMLTAARLDGTLERMHKTPMGEMPGAGLGGFLTLDVFVHGWDLARATGQQAAFDADLATHLLGFAEQAVGSDGRDGGLIGPVVAVDSGAPVTDRLVGYLGRTP